MVENIVWQHFWGQLKITHTSSSQQEKMINNTQRDTATADESGAPSPPMPVSHHTPPHRKQGESLRNHDEPPPQHQLGDTYRPKLQQAARYALMRQSPNSCGPTSWMNPPVSAPHHQTYISTAPRPIYPSPPPPSAEQHETNDRAQERPGMTSTQSVEPFPSHYEALGHLSSSAIAKVSNEFPIYLQLTIHNNGIC